MNVDWPPTRFSGFFTGRAARPGLGGTTAGAGGREAEAASGGRVEDGVVLTATTAAGMAFDDERTADLMAEPEDCAADPTADEDTVEPPPPPPPLPAIGTRIGPTPIEDLMGAAMGLATRGRAE